MGVHTCVDTLSTPGNGIDVLSTPKYPNFDSSNTSMQKFCLIPKEYFLGGHPVHTGRTRKIFCLYLCVKDSSSSGVRTLDLLPLPESFIFGVLTILATVPGHNPNSNAAALADLPL